MRRSRDEPEPDRTEQHSPRDHGDRAPQFVIPRLTATMTRAGRDRPAVSLAAVVQSGIDVRQWRQPAGGRAPVGGDARSFCRRARSVMGDLQPEWTRQKRRSSRFPLMTGTGEATHRLHRLSGLAGGRWRETSRRISHGCWRAGAVGVRHAGRADQSRWSRRRRSVETGERTHQRWPRCAPDDGSVERTERRWKRAADAEER